ncbi:peptidase [Actinomadura viridis]|uniref:V8-like Glu-specific endopeptidase n=1 Tax=Actinomadura viridis TaxID=58110 RepID=A0A931DDY9_9ACTN|nr:trypsin-like peptidase domain-containing protein [Actinomadura viridis]MBG6087412.1 V8-like Glu-specific endopeptidase [Actinomadura viridis]
MHRIPGKIASVVMATATVTAGLAAPARAAAPAPPAPPAPDTTTAATARTSDGARVDSAAAAKKVGSYWTAERMRRARPVPAPEDRVAAPAPATAPAPAPAGRPSGRPGSHAPARAVDPAAIRAGARALAGGDRTLEAKINDSAAVGKVFFRKPSGGDWACSAAALNSSSRQLVVTAGHCVHEGDGGGWMLNWTFVPRYRNGARPFGTFAAKQFRAFNAWINNGDLRRDVGMVTTWPQDGKKLVNVVGGNGLQWNWPRTTAMTVFGYPGNRDNGQIQWVCQGTTSPVIDGRIQLRCDFGGGSSGGPWLRQYNDSNGLGYVNGTMSTISSGGWNRSPYFDNAVKAMFDAQGGVT